MPTDVNATIQALEPIIGPLNHLMGVLQYLVGGIFGLYLILVILRWYESRRLATLMRDVKSELKALNKHFGVKVKPTRTQKEIKRIKRLFRR